MVTHYCNLVSKYSLLLYIFFLPTDFHLSSLMLIPLYIGVLFQINIPSVKQNFKYFIPFLLLFFIYIVHNIFNNDQINGLNFLYLFVLFFLLINIDENWYKILILAFIYGLIFSWGVCIIYPFVYSFSFETYSFTPIQNSKIVFHLEGLNFLNYFFSQQFTKTVMDRAYFALYFNIGLVIILFTDFIKSKRKLVFSIFFIISIIQSNSHMGYTVLAIILAYYFLYNVKIFKKEYNFKLISLIIFSLVLFIFYISNAKAEIPIDNTKSEISRLDYRKLLWANAAEIISPPSLLGYGGQKSQHLMDSFLIRRTNWSEYWIKNKYNAHNQYFQFLLEIGYLGLILYFMSFIMIVYLSRKSNLSFLIFIFCIVILISGLSESILERYNGIALIIFLYSLFLKKILNETR